MSYTSSSPWYHPAGTSQHGSWLVDLCAEDSVTQVNGWKYTALRVAELATGESVTLPAQREERIIVPLSGSSLTVLVGDSEEYELAGRPTVFHGSTDVLYTGVETSLTITASEDTRVAVASGPANATYPTRHITKEEIPVELRGAGMASRQVNNFGTPETLEADRLIVSEVITPAGNWSSYPPHKHDEEKEDETALEEIYYYEMRPAKGMPIPSTADGGADPMGYQRVYSSSEDRQIDIASEVRSGDAVLMPYGWHGPSMTPPGYDMYYLNVMAGPGPVRAWLISDDPHHGWVRKSWEAQEIDPRLPFSE